MSSATLEGLRTFSKPLKIPRNLISSCHSQEALRSIVISQRLLGTREVAVFHHTGCGMLTFTNKYIRDKVKAEAPGSAAVAQAVDNIDFLTFSHLEESVKDDVNFLKENPLILEGTVLTGWIYDVTTGKVKLNLHIMNFIRNSHSPQGPASCLNS